MGMFLLFFKRSADVRSPLLSAVFWQLLRLGSFAVCGRQANAIPIQKGPPSPSVANYRLISITSVLSKVFERMVSVRLTRFIERSAVCFQPPSFHRIGPGTCDEHFCVSHTLQSALESGQEARIVQIDFSEAFDRENRLGILYKLCSGGIGGSVLYIST